MELEEYDKVAADTLESGDIIKITQGFREIDSISDNLTHIQIITDNGEELLFDPDAIVTLYTWG